MDAATAAMHLLNGNGTERKKSVNNGIERKISAVVTATNGTGESIGKSSSGSRSRKTSVNSVTSSSDHQQVKTERKKSVLNNGEAATTAAAAAAAKKASDEDALHQRDEQTEQREAFVKLLSQFIR